MNKPFQAATRPFHERAQANADYFGVPFVCFFDTSGQYRCERLDPELACHRGPGTTLITPKRYDDSNVRMLGDVQ